MFTHCFVRVAFGLLLGQDSIPTYEKWLIPSTTSATRPGHFLTRSQLGDPYDIAMAYLYSHANSLGLRKKDLDMAEIQRVYQSPASRITHLYLIQIHQGIPIDQTQIAVHIGQNGEVISVSSRFLNLSNFATRDLALLLPEQAADRSAKAVGLEPNRPLKIIQSEKGLVRRTELSGGGFAKDEISVKLKFTAHPNGELRLTWESSFKTQDNLHDYLIGIDAETGETTYVRDLVIIDSSDGNGGSAVNPPPSQKPRWKHVVQFLEYSNPGTSKLLNPMVRTQWQ